MDQIEMIMRDLSRDFGSEQQSAWPAQANQAPLANILRVVSPLDRHSTDASSGPRSTAQDWSDLIDRVRSAANRVREAEADANEQELRVRELLERVREDMKTAHDRARAADAHAQEVQARSDALLKAADERIKEAEERARTAEAWLSKISATIAEEFAAKENTRLTA